MNANAEKTNIETPGLAASAAAWPRITVVTPCKDRPKYLEEAIRSVVDQNYPNLEFIIVDGGSTTPEVFEILRRYEERLAWWVSEPDRGNGEATAKGLARSTGEIQAYLCSDDRYEPGALQEVAEIFATHPEVDVVYGNAYLIGPRSERLRELRAVPFNKYGWLLAASVHTGSVFWRRGLYDQAGGIDGTGEYVTYATDHDLFERFIQSKARFWFTRSFLSSFRLHGDQITGGRGPLHDYEWKVMQRGIPVLRVPGAFHALKAVMRARKVVWHLRQGELSYVFGRFARGEWDSIRRTKLQ